MHSATNHSRALYATVVFLAAFLLFLVEPMVAKQLLPEFGGVSSVWITCLVFFQVALFVGYLYAHILSSRFSPHAQAFIHVVLLAFSILALWLHPGVSPHPASNLPVAFVLLRLTFLIGFPFAALSATNPLLQVWLTQSHPEARLYRLYALSNAGSLIALALYPTVVEPHLSMHLQFSLWSAGYLLFCFACGGIAWSIRSYPRLAALPPQGSSSPIRQRILWLVLPACGCMLLCAITSHLTQNIAAIPLLWVVPLAAYLLTFIAAFNTPGLYHRGLVVRLLALFLASLTYLLTKDTGLSILLTVLVFVLGLIIACYLCHAELYALRPAASELTRFYLSIAAGGAAGTLLVGVLAPLVFSANYDLVAAFLCTAASALLVTWNDSWGQRLLWSAGTAGMAALIVMLHIAYRHDSLFLARNFYGTLRVRETVDANGSRLRTMLNGNIRHGTQFLSPTVRDLPTSYYAPESGVGLALTFCCGARARHIGVVGLGTGTVAAYGLAHDHFRFYEINPTVEPTARRFFTYLSDTHAAVDVVPGDARLSLSSEPSQQFDVLIIDAFSGDSIPIHLLTREAMQIYARQLRSGGILAVHVSNQYLDLSPVVARAAEDARVSAFYVKTFPNEVIGEFASTWILVTGNQQFLSRPEVVAAVHPLKADARTPLWTDDYSSLLPLLHAQHEP